VPSFDHLIYGGPVLVDMVDDLAERLGVTAGGGGRHLGLGTRNALLSLGNGAYLEIAAPDPQQTVERGTLPFDLDQLEHPRIVGWVARCEQIGRTLEQARASGCDFGEPTAGSRQTPEGSFLHWQATGETIGAGVVPFLIEWGEGRHPSRAAPSGADLLSFHLEHPVPLSVQPWLTALDLNVDVVRAPEPAMVATISGPSGMIELR
jgi:hypothetical protein